MSLDEKTNVQPPAEPVHEDFLPPSDWDRQKESDTLILMLPGFRKEQLKVQVSSNRKLRLSGERKINENKMRRFRKEEALSEYHDTSGIIAKFEAGMLYVKLPKVSKPQTQPTPTPEEPSKPQQQKITDDKANTLEQQSVDEKEDHKSEELKTEEAETPAPHQAENNEDLSQEKPEKEMSEAEKSEDKSKSYEAEEMHGTTETALKEEDSEKKEKGNEMGEAKGSKADGWMGVAKMDIISDLILEVKKQNKVANLVVLLFLLLFIGLYFKTLVKSSFGGPKNFQDL